MGIFDLPVLACPGTGSLVCEQMGKSSARSRLEQSADVPELVIEEFLHCKTSVTTCDVTGRHFLPGFREQLTALKFLLIGK